MSASLTVKRNVLKACSMYTGYRYHHMYREALQALEGGKRGSRAISPHFEALPNLLISWGRYICTHGVGESLPLHLVTAACILSSACRAPGVPSPVKMAGTSMAWTVSPVTASAPPVLVPITPDLLFLLALIWLLCIRF